jgi:hypothetical protein
MVRKLLLLEFNELCSSLLQKWMAAGRLPNFKRFHDDSQVYLTRADAEPPALEPWIQWYSIHTGLSFAQHRIFRLTEGLRADHPDIWTVLQTVGLRTANCSSINARGSAAPGCFFLPDPWSTTVRACPDELNEFHHFVSVQVREHTSRECELLGPDLVAFSSFLATHGLRLETVTKVISQLCNETLSARDQSWKRVTILDMLQLDVFLYYFSKLSPHFSTFFLNSTAHLQHAYWRHMDQEGFKMIPNTQEMANYRDAILYGYRSMDNILARFLGLERKGVTLALATGLSQKPFVKYEGTGGQKFYRPRDIHQLLDMLAIYPQTVEPVMAHEYVLRFATMAERANAAEVLLSVSCDRERVFDVQMDNDNQLYLGSCLQIAVPHDAALQFNGAAGGRRSFHETFYLIEETKSGCHDPEGVFWFKTGRPMVHSEQISILDIFPTVVEFMGIGYGPSERHPYMGRSRVSDWAGA